jgi:phosphate transport system protein
MVEGYLGDAVEALKRRDLEGSRRLIAWDERINERRFAIEHDALALIATQQPMAGDLRILAAMLEIITDLERIGDYAKGISNINLMIGEEPLIKSLIDLPRMAEKGRDMLHRALDAFVRQDLELAQAIPQEDDEVDALYNKVYRDLLDLIIKDIRVIDQATYLLWAAHNLERTADRVVNICERVAFTVTGQMVEMNYGRAV